MPASKVLPLIRSARAEALNRYRRSRAGGFKGASAIIDQGIVSLGNFLTQVTLATAYGGSEGGLSRYGHFGVLFELMLVLNAIQAAVIIYPVTVHGAVAKGDAIKGIGGTGLLLSGLLAPLLGLTLAGMALFTGRYELSLWVFLAVALTQMQETLRRTLMAAMRYGATILGDSVSYLGQAGLIITLAWFYRSDLPLVRAFQAIAITSVLAIVIQYFQVRPHFPGFRAAWQFARDNWGMGRWLLFSNLTTVITQPLFVWHLAAFAGLHMLGIWNGLFNVMRPVHPVIIAFCNVLVPTVARARENDGLAGAKRLFLHHAVFGLLLLSPLFVLPFLFPDLAVRLLYRGSAGEYLNHTHVLQLIVLIVLLHYIHDITGAFFNAITLSRYSFIAQISYTVVIVGVAMPAAATWGLYGAAVGRLLASAVMVSVLMFFLLRLRSEARPRGFEVKSDAVPVPNPPPAGSPEGAMV